MEPLIVIIGLFLFFAVYSNKDIREKDKEGEDTEIYTWFAVNVIFIVLCGLGFLLMSPSVSHPNYAFLLPIFIGFVTISTMSKGYSHIFAVIALASVFIFLIMGSFM